MASGVDDDARCAPIATGFKHVQLRPRRLLDATKVDMRTELWGTTYNSPIFTCPTGGEKSFHADGELAVARATKARGTLQVLSTATSTAVEDVCKAHGPPVWYQLYAPSSWAVTEKIVHRVEAAGCPVIALTVDNTTGRNSETYMRTRPKDLAQCAACHGPGEPPGTARAPDVRRHRHDRRERAESGDGLGIRRPPAQAGKGKLMIKGIDTREDARLALDHGTRRHSGFEPRRTLDGNFALDHRSAAGSGRRSRRPHSGIRRRRFPPRDGCFQSPGAGR